MSLHNETLKTIRDRRSIRRYEETMPTREEILTVVEAGRCAPSGGNTQTTRFTVITNPQVLQQLQQLARQEFAKMDCDETTYKSLRHAILASKKGDYPMLYGAPVLILVSNLRTYGNNYSDCACALQNMMLAAQSIGLGTCWINQVRWLNEHGPMIRYLQERCRIPQEEQVCGGVILGIPAAIPGELRHDGYPVTFIE